MNENIEEFLKIKNEKELYRYVNKLTAQEALQLLYALPQKHKAHACFIVFAFCDYNAKIGREKTLSSFVQPLYKLLKKEKKFRANIVATLNFLLTGPLEKPKRKEIDDDEDDDNNPSSVEVPINPEWEDDEDERDETKEPKEK